MALKGYVSAIEHLQVDLLEKGDIYCVHADPPFLISIDEKVGPFIDSKELFFRDYVSHWDTDSHRTNYINILGTLIPVLSPHNKPRSAIVKLNEEKDDVFASVARKNLYKAKTSKSKMSFSKTMSNVRVQLMLSIHLNEEISIFFCLEHIIRPETSAWVYKRRVVVECSEGLYYVKSPSVVNIVTHLRNLYELNNLSGTLELRQLEDFMCASNYNTLDHIENNCDQITLSLMLSLLAEGCSAPNKSEILDKWKAMYDPVHENPATKFKAYIGDLRMEDAYYGTVPICVRNGEILDRSDMYAERNSNKNDDTTIALALLEIYQMNSSTSTAIHPIHGVPYKNGRPLEGETYFEMDNVGVVWFRGDNMYAHIYVNTNGYYILQKDTMHTDCEKVKTLKERATFVLSLTD